MILLGYENNFKKASRQTMGDFGAGYHYGKIMHYSSYAFSKNGKPSIIPKVSTLFPFPTILLFFSYQSNDVIWNIFEFY